MEHLEDSAYVVDRSNSSIVHKVNTVTELGRKKYIATKCDVLISVQDLDNNDIFIEETNKCLCVYCTCKLKKICSWRSKNE